MSITLRKILETYQSKSQATSLSNIISQFLFGSLVKHENAYEITLEEIKITFLKW